MNSLIHELQKVITNNRDVEKALAAEFINTGYKKTYLAASHFQTALERKFPGINRWVMSMNRKTGREIQDIVADELRIPGS